MDSKIFKPSCPTCVCVDVFHTSMSIIYIYIYLYMHIDIYGYRFLVGVRFCVRFYTCFSLHSAAIFSAMHDACQTFCAVRQKNASGTEFSIGLEPRNPHARRGRKTFHLPLRIQVLRENDLQGRHQLRVIGHFPCESEQRRSRECTGHRVARRGAPLEPDLLAPGIFVVTHESSGTPIRALRPTP